MNDLIDVIGDLHGCVPILRRLCDRLGYDGEYDHPRGRRLAFVGDLSDRGPDNVGAFRLVMKLVESGRAWNVLGNHDNGMLRALTGEYTNLEGSLQETLNQIDVQPDADALKAHLRHFLAGTPLLLHLDGGRLILAHAGVEEAMLRRPLDAESRRFILNGDAYGRSPEGKTLRRDWAADYHGAAFIVYGHTPQDEPLVRSNSANIDTGAARGHLLTALRWPEREIVSERANPPSPNKQQSNT